MKNNFKWPRSILIAQYKNYDLLYSYQKNYLISLEQQLQKYICPGSLDQPQDNALGE